ncbi:hypothetical protein KH172YL63_03240 [Bacillus sp. KH172YL63]|nr:hypothetical protein KH172YL63_03240 [Bacillus sp. KH172YL63]
MVGEKGGSRGMNVVGRYRANIGKTETDIDCEEMGNIVKRLINQVK